MPTVTLEYSLDKGSPRLLSNRITTALRAVEKAGSLAGAASSLGISYRRLWDLVKQWEQDLGFELIERGKGHRCTLSPAASRWLTAEREVLAKHAETLASLQADLERSVACATREDMPVIRLAGCPDEALSLLRQEALSRDFILEIDFNSSLIGLQKLVTGACEIAGFNFPLGIFSRGGMPKEFRKFFESAELIAIGFARRIQGLAVAPGNPLGIRSMLDVSMKGARYINRAPGTGTRILCDALLKSAGLQPEEIREYGTCAPSHESVAAQIALGKADAGLCIECVAARSGIGFIPLVREAYLLACRKEFVDTPAGEMFLSALREGAWREAAEDLRGYSFSSCGEPVA